jgi:Fe2+ or Zn2+ uptake regulation protein
MEHEKRLGQLRRYFKASNKRYTIERERTLEVIDLMKGLYSIVDLYKKAKSKGLIHAASTLYRNIFTFIDSGFITEVPLTNGKSIYESNTGQNCFLLCAGCGKLEKIKTPAALTQAQQKICKEHNFEEVTYLYQIKGYCSDCQNKIKS